MDPNANLKEQLALTRSILSGGNILMDVFEGKATRLADLVEALNSWIRKGGCLPKAWQQKEQTP